MCWKCLEPIDASLEIFRSTVCPVCGADLRCCRNCRFYEPGAHYDCHETVDEPVFDKERANFCGFFSVSVGASGSSGMAAKKQDARAAFDSLFSI